MITLKARTMRVFNRKIIFLIIPLMVAILPILNIYGQEKPDLVLELEGNYNTKVKEFSINNDEVWNEMCPSNQCRIEFTSINLIPPQPEIEYFITSYSIGFNVIDNITHADVTPVKKKFIERFQLGYDECEPETVDDIIETNTTVIYNCAPERTWIDRIYDKTWWYFDVYGTYDSAKENLKISGKFDKVAKVG